MYINCLIPLDPCVESHSIYAHPQLLSNNNEDLQFCINKFRIDANNLLSYYRQLSADIKIKN